MIGIFEVRSGSYLRRGPPETAFGDEIMLLEGLQSRLGALRSRRVEAEQLLRKVRGTRHEAPVKKYVAELRGLEGRFGEVDPVLTSVNPDVQALQSAMKILAARAVNGALYDPQREDGILSGGTIVAAVNVVLDGAPQMGLPFGAEILAGISWLQKNVKWIFDPSFAERAVSAAIGVASGLQTASAVASALGGDTAADLFSAGQAKVERALQEVAKLGKIVVRYAPILTDAIYTLVGGPSIIGTKITKPVLLDSGPGGGGGGATAEPQGSFPVLPVAIGGAAAAAILLLM